MKTTRNTIQRQIILNALANFDTHPTVEEIYLEIKNSHPNISKSTVYRNLRYLAQKGIIIQVILADGAERYDKRADRHYHFKCNACQSICDIDIAYIKGINERVNKKYGLQVDTHDVIFRGICPACKKKAI